MTASRLGRALACAGMVAWASWGGTAPAAAEDTASLHTSSAMLTGALTSQPIGHYEFCKANPAECAVRSAALDPATMTDALWKRLGKVNRSVNASIKPMNDIDVFGRDEVWAYPDGRGDCEDYVLEKRRLLNAAGLPLSNLLITVVKKPDGEGHAVLTVRTSAGDFILDNLSDPVRAWEETGYRFLKRQASNDTGRWVSIRGGQATAVAAVKAVE